jgi:glutamyl-tRNA reductase|tara:strand:- start:6544 stop:7875 length:1332 start_codon:yes stop_codon:yes gene_type:complete
MHTVNIRVTHNKAEVPILEALSFVDLPLALKKLDSISSIKECIIVQTCNRVEIFAAAEDVDVACHDIQDFVMGESISRFREQLRSNGEINNADLLEKIIENAKKFHDVIEVEIHSKALHHLLRLTSGLESMIVGEDQILGQVRDAYHLAYGANTVGPFFKNVFDKAIQVGKVSRTRTNIGRGAVSVGSAAIELAKSLFDEIEGKTILIVGSGDMGTQIVKSLENLKVKKLVCNRTLKKSEDLAREIDGEVIGFNNIVDGLKKADIVITATSAPQNIIKKADVNKGMDGSKKELIIIDVSIPRNVEDDVENIEGVRLFNIDSLKNIADKNQHFRAMEAIKVEAIIEEELSRLEKQIYHIDVESIVKSIFGKSEEIRKKEVARASRMLGNGVKKRELRILDDLTKVIISRTMSPFVDKIREAAETGDKDSIRAAEKWFLEHKKET